MIDKVKSLNKKKKIEIRTFFNLSGPETLRIHHNTSNFITNIPDSELISKLSIYIKM